jgi:diguanylate cyclase (GGDEF)-like protein/putative nucleotidyltransferase with HDIG domain
MFSAAVVGVIHLMASALHWQISNPGRFFSYLIMAVVCSSFRLQRQGVGTVFSLSLPFVLISIVQLTHSEATVIGCAAALVQCLWSPEIRRRPGRVVLAVGMVATVIAIAQFAWQSLLPHSLRTATPGLFVAATALFFANTFPAAIAARFDEQKRLGRIWKDSYFWTFPYYLIGAAVAGVIHLAGTVNLWETALLVLPVIYVAYRHYRVQKGQLEEEQRHAGDLSKLHLRAIEGLALAVEAKDNLNTRGHLRRVQVYALGLGRELGLNKPELEALHAAALLHDIGKLAVPEHILTKPGKLTPEEFAKMKVHPVVGAEIVEQVQFPYPVAPIVRSHHEKWDGSGYPFGLKGEEIPIGGRILATVDFLDALTSDREYRKALPLEDVMALVVKESGKSFDPHVVETLRRVYRSLDREAHSQAEQLPVVLSTGLAVERGRAPGAGLEMGATDFLGSIATAAREGKLLLDVAQGLSASLDMREIFLRFEQMLKVVLPFDALAVLLRRADTLFSEYSSGTNQEDLSCLEVPMGQGLAGWVAQNCAPILNGNPTVDPGFVERASWPLRSALSVPIDGPHGVLGVLSLYRATKDAFSREELRILRTLTHKLGVSVDNAHKFAEARARANLDGLTELPNAQLIFESFENELARARRGKQSVGLVICNLPGTQELRRHYGDNAGDNFLRAVAQGLKSSCREYDHVGRIGDNRFCMVMPGMKRENLAMKLSRLNEIAAEAARSACGHELAFVVGEVFYPDDGDGAKVLVSIAERRLVTEAQRRTADLTALIAALGESVVPEQPRTLVH